MAKYFTDFSEYASGVFPSDWTLRYDSQDAGFTVEDDAGATGGKVLSKASATNTESGQGISWDDVDGDAERQDVEVFVGGYTPNFEGNCRPFGRGSGNASDRNFYAGEADNENDQRQIIKYVSNTFTDLVSEAVTIADDETWNIRFRINGSDLKLKVWKASNSEPSAWDLETTDTDLTADGWVGIITISRRAFTVDTFGVGTAGDTAPASESDLGPPEPVISEGDFGDDLQQGIDVDTFDAEYDHGDLERSPAGAGTWTVVKDDLTLTSGDTITDDTVEPDTQYDYRLVGYTEADESDGGTISNVVSDVHTAPARPTHLRLGLNRCTEARMDEERAAADGVAKGFEKVDSTSEGAAYSITAEGAQKIVMADQEGGAEAAVFYGAGSVNPGEAWTVEIDAKFPVLDTGVSGAVIFIWDNADGVLVESDVHEMTNAAWERKTLQSAAPDGAVALEVRSELFSDGDATLADGEAHFRDLQVVGPDQKTVDSFKVTGLDEADDVGKVNWFLRDVDAGEDFAPVAELVNATGDQNVEHEVKNLEPATYEITATAEESGRESGWAEPLEVTLNVLTGDGASFGTTFGGGRIIQALVGDGASFGTTFGGGSVERTAVGVVTKADTQLLFLPGFSLDARVGGEAQPFSRASDKFTRRGSGGGGAFYVRRRDDGVGRSKYGIPGVVGDSFMLDLEPESTPLNDDTGRFNSASAWTRVGVASEASARSVFLDPPDGVEARRLGSGSGDDHRIDLVVGSFGSSGEVTLVAIFERVDSDTVYIDIRDDTAGAVVASLTWDFTTESETVVGTNATGRVEVLSDVGPNGGQVVRMDLTLDEGAEAISGNSRRLRAWGQVQGAGAAASTVYHYVALEDLGFGTSPMPCSGTPWTRESEIGQFALEPAPPIEEQIYYATFVPWGQVAGTVPLLRAGAAGHRLDIGTQEDGTLVGTHENGTDAAVSASQALSGYEAGVFVEAAVYLQADGSVRVFGRVDRGDADGSAASGAPASGIVPLSTSRVTPLPSGVRRSYVHTVKTVRAAGITAALDGTADDAVLDELALVERGPLG